MTISLLIIYASIFFWLFPVFRQYKGNYFIYFLILGLSDPIAMLSVAVLKVQATLIHSIAGLFLLYSLDTVRREFRRLWFLKLIIVIAFFVALLMLSNPLFLVLILHSLILIVFIKKLMLNLHELSEFNWFYLVLIFYEITVILKVIVLLSGVEFGIIYFYLTLAFQLLVAIFFTIFREESPILVIRL